MNAPIRNSRTMKDLGVDHPTPAHIRSCIIDALTKGMADHCEYIPVWVSEAVNAGIRQACAEHDAEAVQ